jgi:hypothetical protein
MSIDAAPDPFSHKNESKRGCLQMIYYHTKIYLTGGYENIHLPKNFAILAHQQA